MTYDFTIVKERFHRSGWTWPEWSTHTNPKIHFASIFRAIKTGHASQRTAKAIIAPFGITYEMILPQAKPSRRPSGARKTA